MTSTIGPERSYLPPMGKEWLLPLYDPFTRVVGVTGIHETLLRHADLRSGHVVLEIGCGTGNLLLRAKRAQPGITAAGIDPDLPALARAHRKSRRRALPVRWDHGFADALPYPDGSVDDVLSSFMLHHLPEAEKEPALREVARVLRPGGALHLVDIGGPTDEDDGRAVRRAQQHELLHGNFGDGPAELFGAAGFADVVLTGTERRRPMGRIAYWRATT